MVRTLQIIVVSAGLLVGACKKADKPVPVEDQTAGSAAALTGPAAELQTKVMGLMGQVTQVFVADGNDCDKLSADLAALAERSKPQIEDIRAQHAKLAEPEKAAFTASMDAAQQSNASTMRPAFAACQARSSFRTALKAFAFE